MAISIKDSKAGVVHLLRHSYVDATRKDGLISFTAKVRTEKNDCSGKYGIKQKDLDSLFSKTVWEELSTKSGHRKLINRVTHIVVEYSNHEKDIDPGAVTSILDAIQSHLNILCNDIFCYGHYSWKSEPDYEKAYKKLK